MCSCKNKNNSFKKVSTKKDNVEKGFKYKTVVVDKSVKWLTKTLQLN
jgi:hypothetical protein